MKIGRNIRPILLQFTEDQVKAVLSVENMRKSDAHTIESGVSGKELMMRAANGVYESTEWIAPVLIVCGSGNNGGDGYALALCLFEAGTDCDVFPVTGKFSDDGRYYYDKCTENGISIIDEPSEYSAYGTIVDCMLGTGFTGPVRDEYVSVIKAINSSGAKVVSVDINSGLNGDTGMAGLCVKSDLTVSVGGFKPGHFLNMAKDVMKSRVNCDIGIEPVDEPYRLIEGSDVADVLGERLNFSNKGTYGYVALIGGSSRYSGAIRLAYLANAAMRSGAGVVKVALPSSISHDVIPHILESTIFPLSDNDGEVSFVAEETDELVRNVRTVAFGMGIGTGSGAAGILGHLLGHFTGTLIIDADGLTLLSRMDKDLIRKRSCALVLTPHIKEFSRLTGLDISDIQRDPIGHALTYAKETETVVLLKGPSTIVTDGEKVYITDRGCPGMATAGSGDVLSGILAAICCITEAEPTSTSSMSPCHDRCAITTLNPRVTLCVSAGAFINGAAGELASLEYGDISMIASDTVSFIPKVIKELNT